MYYSTLIEMDREAAAHPSKRIKRPLHLAACVRPWMSFSKGNSKGHELLGLLLLVSIKRGKTFLCSLHWVVIFAHNKCGSKVTVSYWKVNPIHCQGLLSTFSRVSCTWRLPALIAVTYFNTLNSKCVTVWTVSWKKRHFTNFCKKKKPMLTLWIYNIVAFFQKVSLIEY